MSISISNGGSVGGSVSVTAAPGSTVTVGNTGTVTGGISACFAGFCAPQSMSDVPEWVWILIGSLIVLAIIGLLIWLFSQKSPASSTSADNNNGTTATGTSSSNTSNKSNTNLSNLGNIANLGNLGNTGSKPNTSKKTGHKSKATAADDDLGM